MRDDNMRDQLIAAKRNFERACDERDAALRESDALRRELEEAKKSVRKVKCMYCEHEESIDLEGHKERLTDHILTCEKSPLVNILCNLSAGFEPLLVLLDKLAGSDESGWYGSIIIRPPFQEALKTAREAAKGNEVPALTQLRSQLAAAQKEIEELRNVVMRMKCGCLSKDCRLHGSYYPELLAAYDSAIAQAKGVRTE